MLPKISDVMQCAPSDLAAEQLTQLTLDGSKAHRRVLIHPDDRGLLCFHVGDDLYQSICLNFGARASGWYWGRVAGLMVRTSHALLDHHHALWQYVDDLLVWLDKTSAPLWASSLVILFLLLGIPMSWHKAALGPSLTWIGWSICVETWTIQIPHSKLTTILNQLDVLLKDRTASLKELQSALGLGSPPVAYECMAPPTAVADTPLQVVALVDDSLMLTQSLLHQHHSLAAGAFVKRVANTFVTNRQELMAVHTKSRRIWLGITDPMSPSRSLDEDARAALQAWHEIVSSASFCVSMRAPQILPVQATADAMASADVAGLGGAAFFADGEGVDRPELRMLSVVGVLLGALLFWTSEARSALIWLSSTASGGLLGLNCFRRFTGSRSEDAGVVTMFMFSCLLGSALSQAAEICRYRCVTTVC
eukprot:s917_g30.t1